MLPIAEDLRRRPHPYGQGRTGGSKDLKVRSIDLPRVDDQAGRRAEDDALPRDRAEPLQAAEGTVPTATWISRGALVASPRAWTVLISTTTTFRFTFFWP